MCCLSPGSAPAVIERHAALLRLRAFVLTSPYSVPASLTDVLMALVRAAAEPAPIKKTVRQDHIILISNLTEENTMLFSCCWDNACKQAAQLLVFERLRSQDNLLWA